MTLNQLDLLAFAHFNAPASLADWQLNTARFLAEWLVYLVPLSLVLLWLSGASAARIAAVRATVSAATALLVNQAIGLAWDRPRPFVLGLGHTFLRHTADASFPSDHVTALAATGIALCVASGRPVRRVGIALIVAALVAGWARVFLGVHYPGDVLGGLAIAGLTASAFGITTGWRFCTWLTRHVEGVYRFVLSRPIALGWIRA